MSEIRWRRRDDRRTILPVFVLPPRPITDLTSISATALLDTGSTTSGVSCGIAEQLRLPHLGKRPLGSVHGEAQVERYLFRVGLEIEGSPVPFVFEEIIGFELKNASAFDVLLGMDVLAQCDFFMIRDGRCRLGFG
jgi:hypothetical protein